MFYWVTILVAVCLTIIAHIWQHAQNGGSQAEDAMAAVPVFFASILIWGVAIMVMLIHLVLKLL